MNKVILCGRLTRDPDIRYSQGERQMAIARYTLAVDRRGRRSGNDDGSQTADFIQCVAFDRAAEFAEKFGAERVTFPDGQVKEFGVKVRLFATRLDLLFRLVWYAA